MSSLIRLAGLVGVAAMAPAAPAAVTDVAELFPADTLAYAEVRKPADVADAVAAVFAGSPAADSAGFAHDRIDRAKFPNQLPGIQWAGLLNLVAAPELAAEARRLRGAAVGVVGFSDRHEPRVAAAVLLGDSAAAGLAARAYLAATPNLRRVADVDGVPVFQHRGFTGPVVGTDGQPLPDEEGEGKGRRAGRPTAGTDEFTYAHVPGLFVVGTDVPAVADVLRRFAGKPPGGSLATADSFAKHAAARDRGGVYFYAAPPALLAKLDQVGRESSGRGADPAVVAWWRFAVGAQAVRTVAGNLVVRGDAVTLTAEADVDGAAPSAALGLLTGPPVTAEFTRHAAGKTAWAVTLSMPPAEARAKAVLALLDARAKAVGALGRPPSEVVAEADRGDGPNVADLIAGVRAVTAFAPVKPELPSGAGPVPVLVLHTESDEDADAWEQAAPRLLALVAGATPSASAEEVGGVRVRTFATGGLPGNAPLHVARAGSAVVVGQDRKLVAEAAQGKGAAAAGGSTGVFHLTPAAIADAIHAPPAKPQPEAPARPVRRGYVPPPVLTPEPPAAGLAAALRPLPAVTGTVARDADRVRVEVRLPGAKAALSAAWAGYLSWVERQPVGPTRRPGFAYPE